MMAVWTNFSTTNYGQNYIVKWKFWYATSSQRTANIGSFAYQFLFDIVVAPYWMKTTIDWYNTLSNTD